MAQVRSINHVLLVGRIGSIYPRYKTTRSGKPGPLNISVSTQEIYRNDKSRNDWHKVTFWGVNADFAEKYLQVGALVAVEAKLRTVQRKNPDGSISAYVNIEGQQLTLLVGPKRGEGDDQDPGCGGEGSDQEPEDVSPDDMPDEGTEIDF